MKKRLIRGSALLATLLVLAGCAVGPDYQRPAAATPAAYKEAALPLGSRQLENRRTRRASPARRVVEAVRRRGPEPAAGRSAARQPEPAGRRRPPDAGRALQREARAAFFPSLDAAFGPSRQRPSGCAVPDGTPTSRRPPGAPRPAWPTRPTCSAAFRQRPTPPPPTRSRARRCTARCCWRCRPMSPPPTSWCASRTPRRSSTARRCSCAPRRCS